MEFLSQEDFGLGDAGGISLEELTYSMEIDGYEAEKISNTIDKAINAKNQIARLETIGDSSEVSDLAMEAILTQIDAPAGASFSSEGMIDNIKDFSNKAWRKLVKMWKQLLRKIGAIMSKVRSMFTAAPNYSQIRALLKNPDKFLKKTKGRKLKKDLVQRATIITNKRVYAHRRETLVRAYDRDSKTLIRATIKSLKGGSKKTVHNTLFVKYAFKGKNFTAPKIRKIHARFAFREAVKNQKVIHDCVDRIVDFGKSWANDVFRLTRTMGIKGERYQTIASKVLSVVNKDVVSIVKYYSEIMIEVQKCQAILDSARTGRKVNHLKTKAPAVNHRAGDPWGG